MLEVAIHITTRENKLHSHQTVSPALTVMILLAVDAHKHHESNNLLLGLRYTSQEGALTAITVLSRT